MRTFTGARARDRAFVTAAGVVLFASALTKPTAASGYSVARFGGEHGHPMTTEPTAIYYNPSGIVDAEGGHAFADVSVAWRKATYERGASDTVVPAGASGANAGQAKLLNIIAEPFLGVTYRLGKFAVGASFSTPFGGQESWDKNNAFKGNATYPGAVDGVQRWYAIQSSLRSSFFSVAGAYAFGNLRIGLAANLVDTVVDTVQARESTGSDDVRTEGRALLSASSYNVSAGAGVTYEPIPQKLRLGLSYQSRPDFGSGIKASGTLRTVFGGSQSSEAVTFTTDLPDVVRAGASYRVAPNVELRLFGDYQRWSVLKNQCIMQEGSRCDLNPDGSAKPGSVVILNFTRNFQDTFGVRAGGSYYVSPDVELVAGAGYTSNAIPSSTLEPALLDFNAITAAAGGVFALGSRFRLATTYTEVFYLPRDTTGQSVHPTLAGPSRSPDSGGKYTLALGLLNVNLDFAF